MRRVETVTEPDIYGSVSISSYSLGQARTQKVRAFRGMKKFIKFTLIWISQNLAIPFWIVGHIHLSVNIYKDIHELLYSLGMNIVVLIGFLIDFKTNGER